MLANFLAIILSYLIGSISFAIIISRIMGLGDPRSWGSGNAGATNVLRSGSKLAAILTLILDAAKGFILVFIVMGWGMNFGLSSQSAAIVALAAFLGHIYPVFFRFKGGKGVATALGILLAINVWLGVFVLITWIIVALISRYSSLSAVISAVLAPLYYFFGNTILWYADKYLALSISVISILLLWKHAQNIDRLLRGQESRIGTKK